MSDIYRSRDRHAMYGGIIIDVAEEGLERAQKLLAGISGGWEKAVGSALSRAANSGKTVAKKAVAKEYNIDQSMFMRSTRNINHYVQTGEGVGVVFGYAGYVIPLLYFASAPSSDGKLTVSVKKSSAAEVLDNAFTAKMGHHTGIYERVGEDRFPVRELYGPATPQMMYSNEAVTDAIEDKVVETFEKRIEHEILRVMNGWGG